MDEDLLNLFYGLDREKKENRHFTSMTVVNGEAHKTLLIIQVNILYKSCYGSINTSCHDLQ